MATIRTQYDLAELPEPRFISAASARSRICAIALLLLGAVLGAAAFFAGLGGVDLFMAGGGALALIVCLSVLIYLRPDDWRAWIRLAATPEGLYLVTPVRKVVFAPWRDVLDIAIVRKFTGRRIVSYPQLTLRLPEEGWSKFGKTAGLKGSGPVRDYTFGSLAVSAETLVEDLANFRAAHG
jgi:hypothetical protein